MPCIPPMSCDRTDTALPQATEHTVHAGNESSKWPPETSKPNYCVSVVSVRNYFYVLLPSRCKVLCFHRNDWILAALVNGAGLHHRFSCAEYLLFLVLIEFFSHIDNLLTTDVSSF